MIISPPAERGREGRFGQRRGRGVSYMGGLSDMQDEGKV